MGGVPADAPDSPTTLVETRHGQMIILRNDRFVGRALALYGECGEDEQRFLQRIVKPGGVVVEVGANIGLHTVPLARHLGASGTLIAIEPQSFVFQMLCGNLALAGLTGVRALNLACGAQAGEVTLCRPDYWQRGNFGGVTVSPGEQAQVATAGRETVAVAPLDAIAPPRVHLLKIDVEGMELDVLRGAAATIARDRPALYVENDRAEHSAALIAHIQSLGYRLWWHLPRLYRPDNWRGNTNNVLGNLISVNMLCLPEEAPIKVAGLRPVTGPEDTWQS